MEKYEHSLLPKIEANYSEFTNIEKNIAAFFLRDDYLPGNDYTADSVCRKLYVSPASLTRFSKKLGFTGYREFIYEYQSERRNRRPDSKDTEIVLDTYQEMLTKAYSLIDQDQIDRIIRSIRSHRRIFIYGLGSSGLAAQEFKNRFVRLGVDADAVVDSHSLLMNAARLGEEALVIGISYSGATEEVIDAMYKAVKRGGETILITSRNDNSFQELFNEVVLCAVKKNLEYGDLISPQFPVLVLIDRIYAGYVRENNQNKQIYDETVEQFVDRYIKFDQKIDFENKDR
ncbi:MurR/RpiR family transcriptional regulator [[Clostridium] aminophilum]|uniref:Transcriptional regulator, RpiR family n=1 Tax=[Clostridium] aminophilum TaxID=1526 RepID=A0A1I6IU98_9FIRM|nr:MurR/RpiR family transcriptional regulator [[Clostridium] aminophilum]SFR70229.1 transcriptional regulator, RpiR family [[Clostridium] aminophilum]